MSSKEKGDKVIIVCPHCESAAFRKRTQFREHSKSKNSLGLPPSKGGRPSTRALALIEVYYICPSCVQLFNSTEEISTHMSTHQLSTYTDAQVFQTK